MPRIAAYLSIFLFILISTSFPAFAQDADSQMWLLVTVNKREKSGLRFYVDFQPRLGNDYSELTQLYLRAAVGYQFQPNFSAWVGHGWTPTYAPEFNNEDRWYGQLLWEDHVGTYNMNNRTRIEFRSVSHAGDTSIRLRHQVRLFKPLVTHSRWTGIVSNELFWNLNDTPHGAERGLDQYRIFSGLGYTFNKTARLEFGYQAAFINAPRTPKDRRQDIFLISLNFNL